VKSKGEFKKPVEPCIKTLALLDESSLMYVSLRVIIATVYACIQMAIFQSIVERQRKESVWCHSISIFAPKTTATFLGRPQNNYQIYYTCPYVHQSWKFGKDRSSTFWDIWCNMPFSHFFT